MKYVVFVLLCLLVGTFGRPNFEDNFAPYLSNFDEIFPKEDARIKRSNSNESSEQSSTTAVSVNDIVSNITQLLQIIPELLSGNVTAEEVLAKVSVQNIRNVINELLPFNNTVLKIPVIGAILLLLQTILSGVLSLLVSVIAIVISIVLQVLKILGL